MVNDTNNSDLSMTQETYRPGPYMYASVVFYVLIALVIYAALNRSILSIISIVAGLVCVIAAIASSHITITKAGKLAHITFGGLRRRQIDLNSLQHLRVRNARGGIGLKLRDTAGHKLWVELNLPVWQDRQRLAFSLYTAGMNCDAFDDDFTRSKLMQLAKIA